MYRRGICVAAVVAAVALMAPAGATSAGKGGCALAGVAKITPGLTTTTKPISFSFTGDLSNCAQLGAIKSGKVTASGTGTGSCSGNATHGTGTIRWNTGASSSFTFTTSGTGVLVPVAGKFTSGQFAGKPLQAALVFYTTSPQKCTTAAGLPTAKFAGPSTVGV
jgi:hypothetical protein